MQASALLLLQLAMALLVSLGDNPAADEATRTKAFRTAEEAIQLANSVLAGNSSLAASATPTTSITPAAPTTSAPAPTALALTIFKNPSLTDQVITSSSTNVRIGSYTLENNSSSTVNLSSISIQAGPNMDYVKNFRVRSGGDMGIIQLFVSANAPYYFSGSLSIPAGSSRTVDVYADFSELVNGTMVPATSFYSCVGKAEGSNLPVSCPVTTGQRLTVNPPRASLTAQLNPDFNDPAAISGSASARIGSYKISASSVSDIIMSGVVLQTGAETKNLQNLVLKVNNSAVSSAQLSVLPSSYYTFSFSSPITVSAGNHQILDVYADVLSTATGTIPAAVSLADCNGKAPQLLLNIPCNAVVGQRLTVLPAVSSLTVVRNPDFGDQVVTASSTSVRIGSYKFSASAASSVLVSSVTIQTGANMNYLGNMIVKVSGNQLGEGKSTLTNYAPYTFSGSFTVPANNYVILDVYADIPFGVNSVLSPATTLSACTASISQNGTSLTCPSVPGQALNVK